MNSHQEKYMYGKDYIFENLALYLGSYMNFGYFEGDEETMMDEGKIYLSV